jgi:glycerophosphoryl diester phosphodiesterase
MRLLYKSFLAILSSFTLASEPIIIAHRGASADAPENSLSAMKLAWAQHADAIEFDLHLSADGQVIVFHDTDISRYSEKKAKVADLTAAQLSEIDIGRTHSAKYAGERIPTLSSILDTVPAGRKAVLEIKCGPEIVPPLRAILEKPVLSPEQLVFISFQASSLTALVPHFPKSQFLYLHSHKAETNIEALIELAQQAKFTGLNLQQNWPLDALAVAKVRAAGLSLYTWTIDDPAKAKVWMELGVDGITTNQPAQMRKALAHKELRSRPNKLR